MRKNSSEVSDTRLDGAMTRGLRVHNIAPLKFLFFLRVLFTVFFDSIANGRSRRDPRPETRDQLTSQFTSDSTLGRFRGAMYLISLAPPEVGLNPTPPLINSQGTDRLKCSS